MEPRYPAHSDEDCKPWCPPWPPASIHVDGQEVAQVLGETIVKAMEAQTELLRQVVTQLAEMNQRYARKPR